MFSAQLKQLASVGQLKLEYVDAQLGIEVHGTYVPVCPAMISITTKCGIIKKTKFLLVSQTACYHWIHYSAVM
jgi:hypothetical protein